MSKLFKIMTAAERKSVRFEVRITEKEAESIRASALTRNLSVADFMRRAALGRRADLRYETEIVLSLIKVVQSIRSLHSIFMAQGFPPPKNKLGQVLDEALAAMLRISR